MLVLVFICLILFSSFFLCLHFYYSFICFHYFNFSPPYSVLFSPFLSLLFWSSFLSGGLFLAICIFYFLFCCLILSLFSLSWHLYSISPFYPFVVILFFFSCLPLCLCYHLVFSHFVVLMFRFLFLSIFF